MAACARCYAHLGWAFGETGEEDGAGAPAFAGLVLTHLREAQCTVEELNAPPASSLPPPGDADPAPSWPNDEDPPPSVNAPQGILTRLLRSLSRQAGMGVVDDAGVAVGSEREDASEEADGEESGA